MEESSSKSRCSKRRSSFLFKRKSLLRVDEAEASSADTGGQITSLDANVNEDLEIVRHISKLKNEQRDWINVLQRFKNEQSQLKQESPEVIGHTKSMELLTDEDKQFLNGQVDLGSLGRLVDSTVEAVTMRHRRSTATRAKLIHLMEDAQQFNEDLTATIIWRCINCFDELDLRYKVDD